jgi:spermidine synthase
MFSRNSLKIALFSLGFLSIGFQVYLLRELLVVFRGIELVVAIALALWILINGTGALLGRLIPGKLKNTNLVMLLLFLVGFIALLMIPVINLLAQFFIPYGSIAGFGQMLLLILIIQLPFCLLTGFLFVVLSGYFQKDSLSVAYGVESAGSAFAGLAVNLVLLSCIGNHAGLSLIILCYLILLLPPVKRSSRMVQISFLLVLVLQVPGNLVTREILNQLVEKQYLDQEVIANHTTQSGLLTITRSPGQLNFYENGAFLYSSANVIENEENSHYAMLQHLKPRSVLVISGDFPGLLKEIIKYSPESVDYVEFNPALAARAGRYQYMLKKPVVKVYNLDPRKFIRETVKRYDVVLINLPPPGTLQINRYYSIEFLTELKRSLNPDGIVSWSLPSGGEYTGEWNRNLNALFLHTLEKKFAHTLIIPGGKNYFLASDNGLSIEIPSLVNMRSIQTTYVNQYYLDLAGMKERSSAILNNAMANSSVSNDLNQDFSPVAVWYQTWNTLLLFQPDHRWIILSLIIFLLLLVITLNPENAGVFTGGFTIASAEIILIYALQVMYGNIYQLIGLLVALFMVGLALGSVSRSSVCENPGKKAIVFQLFMALFITILSVFLYLAGNLQFNTWFNLCWIGLMAIFGSWILGREYHYASLLTNKQPGVTSAVTYAADLFGGAIGILVTSMVLIPMIGFLFTGLILAMINILSALLAHYRISS